jgi:hypothetical protein
MRHSSVCLHVGAVCGLLLFTGCRSAFIAATISNRTDRPIELVEVDYPSASFGTDHLAPGADFHYRFKVIGSGPMSLQWTDAEHHDHKLAGPDLHENLEGRMTITFTPTGPQWNDTLKER